MHIADPDVLAKLKAAPDGVYILVIGESLTRDHMHVYGYKRETTPFQTEANIDPHYTFLTMSIPAIRRRYKFSLVR